MTLKLITKHLLNAGVSTLFWVCSTPRTDYQGTAWYFCSDTSQTVLLKNPPKYLPKAP